MSEKINKTEFAENLPAADENKKKSCGRTMIGGQALMEGVMMRGSNSMAMAVRSPDGNIMLETSRLKGAKWYNKIPIIRGVASFILSLVTGVTTLLKSAEVSTPEEETPGKGWMALAVVLGVVFAVGLFILLPSFLNSLLFDTLFKVNVLVGDALGVLISSLFEGVLRIVIFVLYLFLVSRMKDIRRTFMYHGAEHRTINCFEKGLPMTVENVQKCSTRHNRCGTTFLFFVMIISILVFSLCNWFMVAVGWGTNMFIKMGIRLLLLPLVAGLSYELLRGLALMPDNWFTNILRAPGLGLQRLTTYPPKDDMAEVALKSFLAVYEMDADPSITTLKFGEYQVNKMRAFGVMMLKSSGLDERECESEVDWILCSVLSVKRSDISNVKTMNLGQYKRFIEILDRRATHEPLDYILGRSEFYGLKISVNNNVLIPRMETEILCEEAIKLIGDEPLKVLDMCTGSGAIALVVSKNTKAEIVAADISDGALAVAKENLNKTGVTLIKSDMFNEIDGMFDVIVSNPPYIPTSDIALLEGEVKLQPVIALDGGADGLEFYRKLKEGCINHLKLGGNILMEIGYNQADAVKEIFSQNEFNSRVIKDLDGNDRIVISEVKHL